MSQAMEGMPGALYDTQGDIIPRLYTLRRVPKRYRQILPLAVMKRHQCVVVGGVRGMLTVAITDQRSRTLFHSLSKFTGCVIFPVLVDPVRVRLLIQRIERAEQDRYSTRRRYASLRVLQVRSIVAFVSCQHKRSGTSW